MRHSHRRRSRWPDALYSVGLDRVQRCNAAQAAMGYRKLDPITRSPDSPDHPITRSPDHPLHDSMAQGQPGTPLPCGFSRSNAKGGVRSRSRVSPMWGRYLWRRPEPAPPSIFARFRRGHDGATARALRLGSLLCGSQGHLSGNARWRSNRPASWTTPCSSKAGRPCF